jgi:hypothetical protein
MPEKAPSCVEPARGPIRKVEATPVTAADVQPKEAQQMTARVGQPAPDFEANGYFEGGFKNFKLSDYKGQWVMLCFYPGDFTFV